MNIFDILLISVSLSMDNMAVAAASACSKKACSFHLAFKTALTFCLVGLICLLLGWYGGSYLKNYIDSWDHWLSFVILAYIGGKMIISSLKKEESSSCDITKNRVLFVLAIATNIDVFAIGLTLAFYKVFLPLVMFLLGSFIICFTMGGFFMGKKMGKIFGRKAELFGGAILILIGVKILLQGIFAV